MLKMKETLVISLLICNLRAGSFLFTMAGHCNVMLHSLVPRPHARAREKVWLHKSKSLGPLQNLKASNEIAKRRFLEYCGCERIDILRCELSSFTILWLSLCLVRSGPFATAGSPSYIYNYCTSSHRQAIDFHPCGWGLCTRLKMPMSPSVSAVQWVFRSHRL